jgi:hypothetical protein
MPEPYTVPGPLTTEAQIAACLFGLVVALLIVVLAERNNGRIGRLCRRFMKHMEDTRPKPR